jgi:hypothetical protein
MRHSSVSRSFGAGSLDAEKAPISPGQARLCYHPDELLFVSQSFTFIDAAGNQAHPPTLRIGPEQF